jgi:large subunit ribosomal protein L10
VPRHPPGWDERSCKPGSSFSRSRHGTVAGAAGREARSSLPPPRAGCAPTEGGPYAHGGQARGGRRGLTVKEIAEIRRALARQDVRYRVVKNRLMKIAAQDGVGDALNPLLTGPSAIAFGTDEAATAKAVLDATRPFNRIVRITGGVLGNRAIDADAVTRLAALPAREVLLAKLAGGMQAPVAQLAGLFSAPLRNLGYALQQLAEQKAAEPQARAGSDA